MDGNWKIVTFATKFQLQMGTKEKLGNYIELDPNNYEMQSEMAAFIGLIND